MDRHTLLFNSSNNRRIDMTNLCHLLLRVKTHTKAMLHSSLFSSRALMLVSRSLSHPLFLLHQPVYRVNNNSSLISQLQLDICLLNPITATLLRMVAKEVMVLLTTLTKQHLLHKLHCHLRHLTMNL
jgi:hypothetical protein